MTSRSSKSNGNSTPFIQNHFSLNNTLIGDFKIGAKLGQGTFSKVCQGIHLPTGEKVAIKILEKSKLNRNIDKIRLQREMEILKKLRHPNIVQLYSVIETEHQIFLIMEYIKGQELFQYILLKKNYLKMRHAFISNK